jgi:hypothetical protein
MSIQPGVGYTFNASSQGSNFNIEKPWAPWANYAVEAPTHPFKIVNVSIRTSGESSSVIFQVQSGTVNNLVPLIDDYISETTVLLNRVTSGVADPPTAELVSSNYEEGTNTCYITLRVGAATSSPYTYPDTDVESNQYPVIIGGNEITPDENTWAFLVIGTITVDDVDAPTTFTVSQNVMNSLWTARFQCGTDIAEYFWSTI